MTQKYYWVYILTNARYSCYYSGVTNDLHRRISEHKEGVGSSFVKRYNLDILVYYEQYTSVYLAIRREKQLKWYRRQWKIDLIRSMNPEFRDLFFS